MTKTELIKLRKELLKQMNKYIIEIGDEEIWSDWIALGVPNEPSEDDYDFIAEEDKEWNNVCELFGRLVHEDN